MKLGVVLGAGMLAVAASACSGTGTSVPDFLPGVEPSAAPVMEAAPEPSGTPAPEPTGTSSPGPTSTPSTSPIPGEPSPSPPPTSVPEPAPTGSPSPTGTPIPDPSEGVIPDSELLDLVRRARETPAFGKRLEARAEVQWRFGSYHRKDVDLVFLRPLPIELPRAFTATSGNPGTTVFELTFSVAGEVVRCFYQGEEPRSFRFVGCTDFDLAPGQILFSTSLRAALQGTGMVGRKLIVDLSWEVLDDDGQTPYCGMVLDRDAEGLGRIDCVRSDARIGLVVRGNGTCVRGVEVFGASPVIGVASVSERQVLEGVDSVQGGGQGVGVLAFAAKKFHYRQSRVEGRHTGVLVVASPAARPEDGVRFENISSARVVIRNRAPSPR